MFFFLGGRGLGYKRNKLLSRIIIVVPFNETMEVTDISHGIDFYVEEKFSVYYWEDWLDDAIREGSWIG